MNNSGEHKRFHFTYKESIPAQFVKLWDAPARWFYKWLKGYDPSNPHWARSQSRTPKKSPKRTAQAVVRLVCSIRNRLVKTKHEER